MAQNLLTKTKHPNKHFEKDLKKGETMNSIFSTQNETNSIAQIALTKKQQRENSGVKFGNVLQGQLQTFNDIVNQNEMTLAKTQSLATVQNAMQNSANANLNSQSDIFALKIETQSVSETSSLLADMLASLGKNSANVKLYGYSVDSKGFMGADFNATAGLPQDFKIHSSTLEAVHNAISQDYINKLTAEYYNQPSFFNNIDIAAIFKRSYGIFSQIANISFGGKTSFSEADLATLPKGYSDDDFYEYLKKDKANPKVTAIYKDEQNLAEARKLGQELFENSIEVIIPARELNWVQNVKTDTQNVSLFNPDMSMYKDGENYTLEALFIGLMKVNLAPNISGSQTQINPYIETMEKIVQKQGERISIMLTSFEKLAKGEANLNEILKAALEKGLLDMHLYANEQGKRLSQMTNPTELEQFFDDFQTAQSRGYKPSTSTGTAYINNLYKEFMPKIQTLYAKYGV